MIEYEVVKNTDINDMPTTLIDWLLGSVTLTEGQTVPRPAEPKRRTTTTNVQPSTDIKYITHDAELRNILDLLPEDYLTNYDKWLLVLTAFKRLDKWELFDEWSRRCPVTYRPNRNPNVRRNDYGVICINYIVHLLHQQGHKALPYVTKYREIRPITTDVSRHQINIHNERLYDIAKPAEEIFNYNYNTYKSNDTIIIQSCTGTGKTYAVLTEHTKHYIQEHPETYDIDQ